jgi:anaerobic selenocysteine-containing dehydrogenase
MSKKQEPQYPGPSGSGLASYPPKERWDDWVELDSRSWPERVERRSMLIPTTCFNCESSCGLLAYVDPDTLAIRKFEGNPEHPGSRGKNCAKGPATINQVNDPDRILHPMKRKGARGGGEWERVSWEEALNDIGGRIATALDEQRGNEVMYHVGRPGEDGFTERVLAAWGIDGHNSHTNICSSAARAGYHYWMGLDRPSPDYANADVIFLISAHLESGHYFNPHAQRIMDGKQSGAKVIVVDTRLSNTATHADHWLATVPGSEAALLLAIASYVIRERRYDREFLRRWWNWQEYLAAEHPDSPQTFETFEAVLASLYAEYTFEFAANETGITVETIAEVADIVAGAGSRLATHNWRSAAAGNLGGWQVARCLFFLNALLGAVATEGGIFPNAWNKFVPKPVYTPPHPDTWNDLTWPGEYPLSIHELSFLLPHFLKEGRGKVDVYFTRVYNPVWTNPDGFSWIEALSDEDKVGLHVALTPTWNETAFLADYVLPMGHGPERHDIHSYEQYDGRWVGFRQPVKRVAYERLGQDFTDTRDVNPGQVWEENEFWIDLSWRIDPDGKRGIRKYFESPDRPGERLTVDEYYSYIFENSVPGLPEAAAAEDMTPLDYMRRYGAFEIEKGVGALHETEPGEEERDDVSIDELGRAYTRAPKPASTNVVPVPSPAGDGEGRRPLGVEIDGVVRAGFPTPSGKLEFYSSTLAAWGWDDVALPTYLESHVHPNRLAEDELVLIPTFRLPIQIHTRSGNSKWLDEIAHTNPLWIHTIDAERLALATGDLVRVESRIGHLVLKAWVSEGIRPGVVACSHHMGRWKPEGEGGQRQAMATVSVEQDGSSWRIRRRSGVEPFESADPDTKRIWWKDVGVHQNLVFPVQPDPVSGMHCWHQAVRIGPAAADDRYGDIVVDGAQAHTQYQQWLELTRPAADHSPDRTRRPHWMLRPLKPTTDAYRLP